MKMDDVEKLKNAIEQIFLFAKGRYEFMKSAGRKEKADAYDEIISVIWHEMDKLKEGDKSDT